MFRNILMLVLSVALGGVSWSYIQLSEKCSAEIKALKSELGITDLKDELNSRSLRVKTLTLDMVEITVRFRYDNPYAGDPDAYRECLTDTVSTKMAGIMYEDYLTSKPKLSDFMEECGLHLKSVEYLPQI